MVADLGLDPVDAGPLRFARNIESMTELGLVPYTQGRDACWNIYFQRSNFVQCNGYEGDGADDEEPQFVDAGNLTFLPYTQPPLKPCPQ